MFVRNMKQTLSSNNDQCEGRSSKCTASIFDAKLLRANYVGCNHTSRSNHTCIFVPSMKNTCFVEIIAFKLLGGSVRNAILKWIVRNKNGPKCKGHRVDISSTAILGPSVMDDVWCSSLSCTCFAAPMDNGCCFENHCLQKGFWHQGNDFEMRLQFTALKNCWPKVKDTVLRMTCLQICWYKCEGRSFHISVCMFGGSTMRNDLFISYSYL